MQGRFKVKNVNSDGGDLAPSGNEKDSPLDSPHLPASSSAPSVWTEGQQDSVPETIGRFRVKQVKVADEPLTIEETEGKMSCIEQLPNDSQGTSIETEILESETKGRFKIKNVRLGEETTIETKTQYPVESNENPEVKGRFKVKNVKQSEDPNRPKDPSIETNLLPLPEGGSDRPRSKSSPLLSNGQSGAQPQNLLSTSASSSNLSNLSTHPTANNNPPPSSSNTSTSVASVAVASGNGVPPSAKKGRFTVITVESSSSPSGTSVPSPLKPQTPETTLQPTSQGLNSIPTEQAPLPLNGNGNGVKAPPIKSQEDKFPPHEAEGTNASSSLPQSQVGIALDHNPQNLTAPSSTKKPKSRFTVKTISLEDERELIIDGVSQSGSPQTAGSMPPLPPVPQSIPKQTQLTANPNPPPIAPLDSERGERNPPIPSANLNAINRFQQLLESNFQILAALQQEMKSQGIFSSDLIQSQKIPIIKSSSEKSLPIEENINGVKPNLDSDSHPTNTNGNLKSDSKAHSVTSSPSPPIVTNPTNNNNSGDKEKSFGKMAHYLNELKKELENASKAKKEGGLETQRLRERCVQLEERLQSEKNKNLLLEERLDKSLKKQKELQLQLDSVMQSYQQHQQQIRNNIQSSVASAPPVSENQTTSITVPPSHSSLPLAIPVSLPLSSSQPLPLSNTSAPAPVSVPVSTVNSTSSPNISNGATVPSQSLKTSPTLPPQPSSNLTSAPKSSSLPVSKPISAPIQSTNPSSNIGMTPVPSINLSNSSSSFSSSSTHSNSNTPRYPSGGSPAIGMSNGNDGSTSSNSIHSHPTGTGTGLNQSNSTSSPANFSISTNHLNSNPSHDEFDSFIASRGDVWTDTPAVSITRPVTDSPHL